MKSFLHPNYLLLFVHECCTGGSVVFASVVNHSCLRGNTASLLSKADLPTRGSASYSIFFETYSKQITQISFMPLLSFSVHGFFLLFWNILAFLQPSIPDEGDK